MIFNRIRPWHAGAAILAVGVIGLSANWVRNAMTSPRVVVRGSAVLQVSDPTRDWKTATTVVRARVVAIGAPVWSTPDGSAPTLSSLPRLEAQHQVGAFEPVTFQTVTLYKGDKLGSSFTLWVAGGAPPGPLHVATSSSFQPSVGADVVLFLGKALDWRYGQGTPLPGRDYFQPCLLSGGKADCGGYTLATDQLISTLVRLPQ